MTGWEYRNASRSRWVIGTAIAFALLCLAVSLLGLRSLRELGLSGVGPASAALINLGVLLPALMGLLLGGNALVAAREQGLLPMFAVQPVSRSSLVLGPFLGVSAALGASVLLGFGVAAIVLSGVARRSDVMPLAALVGSTLAVAVTCVAIGIGVSAVSRSRLQATSTAITVWFLLALGMDLVLAAVAPAVRMGPAGLLVAVVCNPLEAGRVLALLGSTPDGTALGPFGAYLVESFGSGGATTILVSSLAFWTLAPLVLARWVIARGDL
jgi:ABC-type transport system involved in multi-copper enzyme maturation permease subunit